MQMRRTALAALVAATLVLGACGADDEGEAAATTTAAPADDISDVAVTEAAMAYGSAVLDHDTAAAHAMLSARCRAKVDEVQLDRVLTLILTAMERQQDVEVESVEVSSALVGSNPGDGTAQAALVLDGDSFADTDFAFLQMQPYVFEDGAWHSDGCDFETIREGFGDPTG